MIKKYNILLMAMVMVVVNQPVFGAPKVKSGMGFMTVSPNSIVMLATTNYAFQFTCKNGIYNPGSQATLLVPNGWPMPQTGNAALPGHVALTPIGSGSSATIDSITGTGPWLVTINFSTVTKNSGFTLHFANVEAPGAAGFHIFKTQTRQKDGALTTLKSGSPTIIVNNPAKADTATVVSSSTGSSIYGEAVTFTARVTTANGSLPTGQVIFRDGDVVLGNAVLDAVGETSLTTGRFEVEFTPSLITAEYLGDEQCNGSVSPAWAQTVAPARLTVTGLVADSKVYDGSPAATVDLSLATLAGVIGDDDVILLTANTSAQFADKNAGQAKSVTVSALALGGAAAANYVLQAPALTANITSRELLVAANSTTREFGQTNPPFSATISGFAAGEGMEVVSGSPAFSTTATVASTAESGPYAIEVSQGTLMATNYTFTFVSGQLTITPATLSGPVAPAPIAIRSLLKLNNGSLQLTIRGGARQQFQLQATTDFKTWTHVGAFTSGDDGQIQVIDPASTQYQLRFYRLVLP